MTEVESRDLPLFFSEPVVLTSGEHGNLKYKPEEDFKFASSTNSIPITVAEFERAATSYPIVFTNTAAPTAIVVTGLKSHENLFVSPEGEWKEGAYIPAYVRKFPFIFMESTEGDKYTLCIEKKNMVAQEDGPSLFDKGAPNQVLNNALNFCKNFHAAWQQTSEFIMLLQKLDLLIERRADIQSAAGEQMSLSGFFVIDRDKFNSLPRSAQREIPPQMTSCIYSHFISMSCWDSLLAMQTRNPDVPKVA